MATLVDGVDSKWIYAGHRYIAIASGMDTPDWHEVMANADFIAHSRADLDQTLDALEVCVDGLYAIKGLHRQVGGTTYDAQSCAICGDMWPCGTWRTAHRALSALATLTPSVPEATEEG